MVLGEWWNQVSGTVLHGLEITAVGMLLVFFTLGLVILAMILLTKLPWLQPKPAPQEPEPEIQATSPAPAVKPITSTSPTQPQTNELAQVAAITVALLHSQRSSVRRVAKSTRGAWQSYGRAHQLGL